jgi:Ca-activated chloride channel family protein
MDRRAFLPVALGIVALASASAHAGAPRWPGKALEAQRQYDAGEFGEAATAYADVISAGDYRAELNFNLGNARYRAAGEDTTGLAAAFDAYQRAMGAAEPALRPEAMYNAADALVRLGRLPEAEKLFREVLRQDPAHDRARYNLELVQRLLEEAQEPQGSQQNPDSTSDQQGDNEPPEDGTRPQEQSAGESQPKGQPSEQQNEEPRGSEDEQPEKEPEADGGEGEQTTPPSPPDSVATARADDRPPPSVSSEEALRELEKLEEAEREHLRQLLQARRRRANVEKDW